MFEFILELDPDNLNLGGLEDFSLTLGNLTINGKYGTLTSIRDKAPYQDFMMFDSLSHLIYGLTNFLNSNQKTYAFEGIDCSFRFFILKEKRNFVLTDSKKNLVAKSTKEELIKSICKGFDEFAIKYKPYENVDDTTQYFYKQLREFKTQFADILMDKTRS